MTKTISAQFDQHLKHHPEESLRCMRQLDEELDKNRCRFGKQVVPCFIKPFFLSEEEVKEIREITRCLTGMIEKVIRAYFEHPELQSIFDVSKEEKPYIEMDPGYRHNVIISRPDGFFINGKVQFIEFNCDSPAGAGYSDVEEKILRKNFFMKELNGKYQWGKIERLHHLLEALLECWKQFGGRRKPHIAIVDWKEMRTYDEFVIVRNFFEAHGCPAVVADPRELKLQAGKLYAGNFRIDVVYRRVIFKELWQKKEQVKDFLRAYRNHRVCVVNPFRSALAANKAVLSILTNSMYDHLFTAQEIAARNEHIPWTRRVIDADKFYGGKTDLLSKLIRENQKNLVLKPAESYGGRDVHIGCEISQKKWLEVAHRALKGSEKWVVQEYVPIPKMTVPVREKGKLRIVAKKFNLNPFVFNGRYAGSMARLSNASVINVSAGGGLIPAVVYRKREKA